MYDPTQEALASPEFQQNAALLDEQAGLNAKTYAQNRQDVINSYQQTLDSLNYGLKQAGLQARSAYGSRNLYNASGSLSGTGELVGTELTQPITRQFTAAQASHEANLNRLALEEQQSGLNIKTKKADLLSGVVANLRKAKAEEAAAALEASKLPGGEIDTLKLTQDQQMKGRTLLYQRDLADAVKKYGNDAIIQIGNQKFLLSSQERIDLAKAKKELNKKTSVSGVAPSTVMVNPTTGIVTTGNPLADSVLRQPALFDSLTPTEKGNIIPLLDKAGFNFLPQKARDSISAVNAARGVLNQIKQFSSQVNSGVPLAQKISGGLASLGGKLGAPGSASQASAALGDIRQALVSTLSRGLGEKGVLTDYDVKRARALVPTPFDTKQEANRKIKMLEDFFSGIEQRAYQVATGTPSSLGLNQAPIGSFEK